MGMGRVRSAEAGSHSGARSLRLAMGVERGMVHVRATRLQPGAPGLAGWCAGAGTLKRRPRGDRPLAARAFDEADEEDDDF